MKVYVLTTAAAQEVSNGPEFIAATEEVLGQKVQVLSVVDETYYSAFGVIRDFFKPDGIVGDLGGSLLELIASDTSFGSGISLPLGRGGSD